MKLAMAFIMDPLSGVDVDKDTTFVLMLEAQRRGHEVWYLEPGAMFTGGSTLYAMCSRVSLDRGGAPHYSVLESENRPLNSFDVVWMRKDPPFNMDYIYSTYMLSLVREDGTLVINDPRGIRESNEKLYTLYFPEVIPETCVSKDKVRLKAFMEQAGGEIVIKPLHGCGGEGVFYLCAGDKNVNVIIEQITQGGEVFVMAQRYISEAAEGDKRIIILNGEPLGAVLRVSDPGDFRCNFYSGGRPVKTEMTERDVEICEALAPRLKSDGLYFVGIDVIGGYLTEVNTTSPTGVQEINRLDGVALESDVIDFVEGKCSKG